MNRMPSRLLPVVVLGLAACAGKQHVPPPDDSPAATVTFSAAARNAPAVTKLTLNAKQCYQGATGVPQDGTSPMRIASGERAFFSARYERSGTFCEVIVSFSPEPQARYVLLPDQDVKLLGGGSCRMAVWRMLPDGKHQTQPVDGWIMRPAGVTCVRPVQVSHS